MGPLARESPCTKISSRLAQSVARGPHVAHDTCFTLPVKIFENKMSFFKCFPGKPREEARNNFENLPSLFICGDVHKYAFFEPCIVLYLCNKNQQNANLLH